MEDFPEDVKEKAADVIDALVEALEAAKGDVNDHKVYVQIDAALSRARGDIPTES